MSIPERHQEAYDAWVAAQKPPRLQKHQNETVWVPCYHERWNKYFDYRFEGMLEGDKPVFKATAEDIPPDAQRHNMDELKWLRADLGGDGLVFSEAVVRRAIAYIKELERRLLGLEK